jgi:hypothetical protein
LAEIVQTKGISCGRKHVGVEDSEIEGPGTPQDMPNVEIVKIFELGANFASIPVTHEIFVTERVKISQKALRISDNVGKRTLAPTKHPPNSAVTHSNPNPCKFHVNAIFFDPTTFTC